MNVFALVFGLVAGDVSAVEAEQYLTARPQTVAYVQAQVIDQRQMTDEQIELAYPTPEGWDRATWIRSVRSIDLNSPAGRR